MTLCTEDPAESVGQAASLQRWLGDTRLVLARLSDQTCLAPSGEVPVLRFVPRGEGGESVELVLTHRGQQLRRVLPWLRRTDAALSRLAAASRLSELSVIMLALLAESRPPVDRPAASGPPSAAPVGRPASPTVVRASSSGRLTGELRRISVGAHAMGRYRASALWSTELGGDLRWRDLFVRVGYQLPATWDLDGRPVRIAALPLAIGWQPRLLGRGRLRLAGLVALAVERVSVRRLDLADATSHAFWEAGGSIGAVVRWRLGAGIEAAVQVEATWMPAARDVRVPEGPSATLDRLGTQLGITLWWGGASG